jgi:predicted nucleotidyltransferase
MLSALRRVLEAEPDVAYALLFGSLATGKAHRDSDADIAVQLRSGAARDVHALGRLAARLESAVTRPIHLVLLDEAPVALAYRIFRDGQVLVERDRAALVARKVRAWLDYLDWKPIEDRCAAGILKAATRGR